MFKPPSVYTPWIGKTQVNVGFSYRLNHYPKRIALHSQVSYKREAKPSVDLPIRSFQDTLWEEKQRKWLASKIFLTSRAVHWRDK